jgi:hypothetical protein
MGYSSLDKVRETQICKVCQIKVTTKDGELYGSLSRG